MPAERPEEGEWLARVRLKDGTVVTLRSESNKWEVDDPDLQAHVDDLVKDLWERYSPANGHPVNYQTNGLARALGGVASVAPRPLVRPG